jgi:eukaryotic-like serine/threonine-protein kinase
VGSRFGKYHIDRKVAIGGMAEIYQAHSTSGIKVAIKKIHPNLASQPKFVQMFLDEARIVIRLRDRHVVQLLDFGKIADTYFFSMEWVDGKALSEIIIRQRQMEIPFPVDVAITIAIDVCAGLHYAHERADQYDRPLNIVHRDVSPPNIMVTRDGLAKVTDFGIADIREKGTQTQPGIIRGKFSYMSPEQSRGEMIDRRSDIFSLGIVIYELLLSTRLFLRDKEVDTIEAVRKCQIPSMRAARGDISAALEETVMKALAPNMKNRFATAAEFGMALHGIREQEFPNSDRIKLTRYMKLLFPDEEFTGAEEPISTPTWKPPSVVTKESAPHARVDRWVAFRYPIALGLGILAVALAEAWARFGNQVLAMLR